MPRRRRSAHRQMTTDHLSASFRISAATLAGTVFSFLTLWLLARNTDVAQFGAFSVAWTGIQALIPLAVIGIPHYVLHRFKAVGDGATCYLVPAATGLGLFTLVAVGLYGAWLLWSDVSPEVKETGMVLLVWLVLVVPVVAVYSKYQYQHRLERLVYWPLWQIVPRTLVVLAVLFLDGSLFYVAVGFVLVLAPLTWISLVELRSLAESRGGRQECAASVSPRELVADAWPYGITEWLEKLDIRLLVPIVAFVSDDRDAAYIAVSASLLFLVYLLPSSVLQRYFLPYLHNWSVHDPARLYRFALRWVLLLTAASVLLIPLFWLVSEPMIIWLYGTGYAPAVQVFDVMMIGVPVLLVSGVVGRTFLQPSEVRRLVVMQTASLLLLVAGVWLLFPLIGLVAIAWAFVAERAVLLLLLAWMARRNYRRSRRPAMTT